MARDIWVTSDTHFGHENILNFKDENGFHFRGDLFPNVQEMNDHMVDKWNSVVKPGDIVYHLGDVFFGDKDEFKKLWPKLVGRKRLVVGNHDDVKWLSSGGFFNKVMMWRMFPEWGVVLSHVPLHTSSFGHKAKFNVHGHIHQRCSPTPRHINVSVEVTDYTPVHIEDVMAYAQTEWTEDTLRGEMD